MRDACLDLHKCEAALEGKRRHGEALVSGCANLHTWELLKMLESLEKLNCNVVLIQRVICQRGSRQK